MEQVCQKGKCSYFIDSDSFHVYRHKFLWMVALLSVIAVVSFGYLNVSFRNSNKLIVETNNRAIENIHGLLEPAKMSQDSCYYANEHLVCAIQDFMQTTHSMLEIETSKIQSDFTVLSLWAGILMIVFLVFSIYSMFKTDEILRQSREGLKAIHANEEKSAAMIETIESKVVEELHKVDSKATDERKRIKESADEVLTQLSTDIDSIKADFSKDVEKKSKEFVETYEEIVKRIEENSKQNNSVINTLLEALQNIAFEEVGENKLNTNTK